MDQRPQLIFFSQYIIGGVQNYYANIIANDPTGQFSKLWIFTDDKHTKNSRITIPYELCEEVVFPYGKENINNTFEQLNKLIPDTRGAILVNHKLELATLHRHRKKNKTIIYVCHDDLYLENALVYEFLIDVYIAHNPIFYKKLAEILPPERKKDIHYLPYGVQIPGSVRPSNLSRKLKVLFLGRLDQLKGIFDINDIDGHLITSGISVDWTILGRGPEEARLRAQLNGKDNFRIYSPDTTDEILSIARQHDICILPSYLDGLPVALLECMSVGLVPIVYRFNDGIDTLITEDVGFIVGTGDKEAFARKIGELDKDRVLLEKMSTAARATVVDRYNISDRVKDYYDLFARTIAYKRPFKRKFIQYNGKLDYPFIPSFIPLLFRRLNKRLKGIMPDQQV